jgi:hypothetical protein
VIVENLYHKVGDKLRVVHLRTCNRQTLLCCKMVVYKLREMLSRSLLRAAPNRAVKSIPQRSTGIVAGARARSLHSTGSRRNAETVQTPTSEEKGFEAHFGEP